jgi:dTDP-4-amino-4,6-dideoxygalactose transaminase
VTLPTRRQCERVLAELWPAGLGVTKLFARAIDDYPYLAGLVAPSETRNARDLAARTLTVTTSAHLGEDELERICTVIGEACDAS